MSDRVVTGVFRSRERAERAVNSLREQGFGDNEISIVVQNERERTNRRNEEGRTTMNFADQNLSNGTAYGGTLGGLGGLLAGAGALFIPGLGPILAAGPIAGALTGAVSGGIAGGLIDWGIPETRGRYLENRVREGDVLVLIRADERKVDKARSILSEEGAEDVDVT